MEDPVQQRGLDIEDDFPIEAIKIILLIKGQKTIGHRQDDHDQEGPEQQRELTVHDDIINKETAD